MNTKLNHAQNWPELGKQANWSCAKLAKLCDVSLRTLERHFGKTIGITTRKWLADHRHKKAAQLLHHGYLRMENGRPHHVQSF